MMLMVRERTMLLFKGLENEKKICLLLMYAFYCLIPI